MKNLATALFGKIAASAFSTSIGGRLYQARAPQGVTWPYAVFYIISDAPMDTFTEKLEDALVQFSLFSKASGTTEVLDAAANLRALYDDCSLTITSNTHLMMERQGGGGTPENVMDDTEGGEGLYWQLDFDYRVLLRRN